MTKQKALVFNDNMKCTSLRMRAMLCASLFDAATLRNCNDIVQRAFDSENGRVVQARLADFAFVDALVDDDNGVVHDVAVDVDDDRVSTLASTGLGALLRAVRLSGAHALPTPTPGICMKCVCVCVCVFFFFFSFSIFK